MNLCRCCVNLCSGGASWDWEDIRVGTTVAAGCFRLRHHQPSFSTDQDITRSNPRLSQDRISKGLIAVELNSASPFSRKYSSLTAACILSSHLNAIMQPFPNYVNPYPVPNSRTKRSALPQLRPGPLPKLWMN